MIEEYEPIIPDSEILNLIKIDENGRKYILIEEYEELLERYKNKCERNDI